MIHLGGTEGGCVCERKEEIALEGGEAKGKGTEGIIGGGRGIWEMERV